MPHPFRNRCLRARQMFEGIFKQIIADRRSKNETHDDFLQVFSCLFSCQHMCMHKRIGTHSCKHAPFRMHAFSLHSVSISISRDMHENTYTHARVYLQVLMDAKYKTGEALSMQEITGIMVATLLGGQHTSNVTGTWAMLHMLLEPQWYQMCLAEQRNLLGDNYGGETLEYEHTKNMTAFDRVISEVLRLHPPFFQLSRVVQEDTPFNGEFVLCCSQGGVVFAFFFNYISCFFLGFFLLLLPLSL